ncbi:MAG: hypothetical protein HYR71_09975 [Chloroflexi bacterium]|nr:hypothetical protein [Chloroflexota bacterium]
MPSEGGRGRGWKPRRWQTALLKALLAVTASTACAILPLAEWAPFWLLKIQVPLTGLALVCTIGKLMYDTLFYDHYWP